MAGQDGIHRRSSASTSTKDPSRLKRKRVLKACSHCRATKAKCTGLFPCDPCQLAGRECDYEPFKPRNLSEENAWQARRFSAGLEKLYRIAVTQNCWPGDPVPLDESGRPVYNEILARLESIDSPSNPLPDFVKLPERVCWSFSDPTTSPTVRTPMFGSDTSSHRPESPFTDLETPTDDVASAMVGPHVDKMQDTFMMSPEPMALMSQNAMGNVISAFPLPDFDPTLEWMQNMAEMEATNIAMFSPSRVFS